MLDDRNFVSETNDANIFMVRNGKLFTPFADACLHGITRGLVMELAAEKGIPFTEKNISLTEMYSADEVFCCGTMGELTPVRQIDGRLIENHSGSSVTADLSNALKAKIPLLSESVE